MSVQTKYYKLLKKGLKTIELRLLDDKRQKLKVGDHIKFLNASDKEDSFKAIIIALHKSDTFENLFKVIDIKKAGHEKPEEIITALEMFYPLNKQLELHVVGIEVKVL